MTWSPWFISAFLTYVPVNIVNLLCLKQCDDAQTNETWLINFLACSGSSYFTGGSDTEFFTKTIKLYSPLLWHFACYMDTSLRQQWLSTVFTGMRLRQLNLVACEDFEEIIRPEWNSSLLRRILNDSKTATCTVYTEFPRTSPLSSSNVSVDCWPLCTHHEPDPVQSSLSARFCLLHVTNPLLSTAFIHPLQNQRLH